MSPRTGLLRVVPLLVVLAVGSGCASYSQKALKVRDPLLAGDFAAAEAFLEKEKPGGDGLPYLMELGLVLRYLGDYEGSNQTFEQAEQLVEELWTKSISKEVLALVSSDETIPYDGEMWERVLIHYYRALNYIDLGQYDGALVEARKLNHRLSVYVEAEDDPPTYRTDAFGQYLTAMLYEADGELNDAWVSMRLADSAYAHYESAYGVPAPASLRRDLRRLAAVQGDVNDVERLAARYPDADPYSTDEILSRGEIIVFWEEGFIPAKLQQEAVIPIFKDDDDDKSEHLGLAESLSYRYHHPRPYRKQDLAYVIRFALPRFAPPVPGPPAFAELSVGGETVTTELAQDLEAIARRGLDDRMGGILLKSIVRALSKYAVSKAAKDAEGKVAGGLVNFLTAAMEKADTRSWLTLPRTIQVARLLVEPGVHDVELVCYDGSGNVIESLTFEGVEVGAGQVQFLAHRTF